MPTEEEILTRLIEKNYNLERNWIHAINVVNEKATIIGSQGYFGHTEITYKIEWMEENTDINKIINEKNIGSFYVEGREVPDASQILSRLIEKNKNIVSQWINFIDITNKKATISGYNGYFGALDLQFTTKIRPINLNNIMDKKVGELLDLGEIRFKGNDMHAIIKILTEKLEERFPRLINWTYIEFDKEPGVYYASRKIFGKKLENGELIYEGEVTLKYKLNM